MSHHFESNGSLKFMCCRMAYNVKWLNMVYYNNGTICVDEVAKIILHFLSASVPMSNSFYPSFSCAIHIYFTRTFLFLLVLYLLLNIIIENMWLKFLIVIPSSLYFLKDQWKSQEQIQSRLNIGTWTYSVKAK